MDHWYCPRQCLNLYFTYIDIKILYYTKKNQFKYSAVFLSIFRILFLVILLSEWKGFMVFQKNLLSVTSLSFEFSWYYFLVFLKARQNIVSLLCVQSSFRIFSILKETVVQPRSYHYCCKEFFIEKAFDCFDHASCYTGGVCLMFKSYIAEFLKAVRNIYKIYFR